MTIFHFMYFDVLQDCICSNEFMPLSLNPLLDGPMPRFTLNNTPVHIQVSLLTVMCRAIDRFLSLVIGVYWDQLTRLAFLWIKNGSGFTKYNYDGRLYISLLIQGPCRQSRTQSHDRNAMCLSVCSIQCGIVWYLTFVCIDCVLSYDWPIFVIYTCLFCLTF